MTINTKEVTGRRDVQFDSMHDFLRDAERMVEMNVQPIGNWTAGQIFKHMALNLNGSIDGMGFALPFWLRPFLKSFVKRRFLNTTPSAGITTSPTLIPGDISSQAGLVALRMSVIRYLEATTATNLAANHLFGKMTNEEWTRFHLRHAELHMSFFVPPSE